MLGEVLSHPLTHDVNVEMDHGGYHSLEEIIDDARAFGCDVVFNCTGLGSSKLCSDDLLVPGRGILLHYDRNCARQGIDDANMKYDAAILTEDGPWGSPTDPLYIIPRGDVFVVGGSYYEGDTGTAITEREKKRLIENATLMGIDTSLSSPDHEWVGFRPARPSIRLDKENMNGVQVVHSYGHGGSGWTAYVGVAKSSVALLDL
jgi:D-amino-acid oxidase